MLNRIKSILANKTIMIRIAITLGIIAIFRAASFIRIPLFDLGPLADGFGTGFLGILNSFSGQALSRFSIMSLGIAPYITASIAVQLMQSLIPRLKEWQEEGEAGKAKTARLTKYLSLFLAFAQAILLIFGVGTQGSQLVNGVDPNFFVFMYMALVVTAGSALTIFLADVITAKGIGNGTSILISVGIMTSIPIMLATLNDRYLVPGGAGNIAIYILLIVLYLLMLLAVIYMQIATRKIPIQYANRQGKSDSNIPVKLNSPGVLPVIFASTILSIPLTVAGFFGAEPGAGGLNSVGDWFNLFFNHSEPIGFIIYILLIIVFSFFYTFMTINPHKIADNLSKSNAFIPGVRPGEDTKNFIARLVFKIAVLGTTYLVLLSAFPIVIAWIFNFTAAEAATIVIGGTGLLIIVGVAVETTSQLETQAAQDSYTGLF